MKEKAKKTEKTKGKKRLLRYIFAGCAVCGGIKVLHMLWMQLLMALFQWRIHHTQYMAASIGIIGGADGPTAIFITGHPWLSYILPVVLLVAGIWGFIRLSRCE